MQFLLNIIDCIAHIQRSESEALGVFLNVKEEKSLFFMHLVWLFFLLLLFLKNIIAFKACDLSHY